MKTQSAQAVSAQVLFAARVASYTFQMMQLEQELQTELTLRRLSIVKRELTYNSNVLGAIQNGQPRHNAFPMR